MIPYTINTLFQLIAAREQETAHFESADSLLFLADLLTYFLTGEKLTNSTLASVSLLYNQFERQWDAGIAAKYGIPDILTGVCATGTTVGPLLRGLSCETGCGALPVISVAAHDTASAVSSIPAPKGEVIFISCGTWSTIGVETVVPIAGRRAYEYGFCNELGRENRNMFVKNMTGLWVLQECVREWENEGYRINYDAMDEHAEHGTYDAVLDLECPCFEEVGGMCGKITDFLTRTGQRLPSSKEDIYRCIVLSLAVQYRLHCERLEELTDKRYDEIYIIGGGSKNKPLCALAARLTGKRVSAGPVEATAVGNILVQLTAMGELKDAGQSESLVKASVDILRYDPHEDRRLDEVYETFLRIISNQGGGGDASGGM